MTKNFLSAAAVTSLVGVASVASAEELRLSHQWSNTDIRDQVAQIVADEVGRSQC